MNYSPQMKFGPFEIKSSGVDAPARDFRSSSCVGGSESSCLFDEDAMAAFRLANMRSSNGVVRPTTIPKSQPLMVENLDIKKRRNIIKHNIYVSWMKEVGAKFKVNLYNSMAYNLFTKCFDSKHYRLPTEYEVQSYFKTPMDVGNAIRKRLDLEPVQPIQQHHIRDYRQHDEINMESIEMGDNYSPLEEAINPATLPMEPQPDDGDLDFAVQNLVFQGYETLGDKIFTIHPGMLKNRAWSSQGINYFMEHCKTLRDMYDVSRVSGTPEFEQLRQQYVVQSGVKHNKEVKQGEVNTYPPFSSSEVTCSSALRDVPSPPSRDNIDDVFTYCDKIVYHYYALGKIDKFNCDREALFAKGWVASQVRTLKYIYLYYKNLDKKSKTKTPNLKLQRVTELHGRGQPYSKVQCPCSNVLCPHGGIISKIVDNKEKPKWVVDEHLEKGWFVRGKKVTYDEFKAHYQSYSPHSGLATSLTGTMEEAAAFTGNTEQNERQKDKSPIKFGGTAKAEDSFVDKDVIGSYMDERGREVKVRSDNNTLTMSAVQTMKRPLHFGGGL